MANEEKDQGSSGWGIWNMVESVGKTITTMAGYDDMEIVDPKGEEENGGEVVDRREMNEETKSFWGQLSGMMGKDITSMLSVPVFFMEPTTVLQKMAEIMEYPHLLTKAAKASEEAERMAWVAAFGVGVYASVERTWKPFNPILGETFTLPLMNEEGAEEGVYLAEQVSHHPPIGAAHAENPYWTYDIVSCPKSKFLGNSIEIYPVGRTRIKLKTTNEEFALVPPTCKAWNLVIGRLWVDTFGEMQIENINNGWKTVLEFVPCGYFGAGRYTVKGNVFNKEGKPMLYIDGKWNDNLGYCQCDESGEPLSGAERVEMWKATEKPANDPYSMTSFVHEHLNHWKGGPLLKSDSRLRPDRVALELGTSVQAQSAKHMLEEMQRAEKKKRVGDGDEWFPKWFKLEKDMKLRDFEYSVDDCPPWTFDKFPEAGELGPVDSEYHEKAGDIFSPWQYPEIHNNDKET